MATISFDFVRHLDLPEHEALARREGRDHVDRGLRALLLVGAAQRLAVDGDHPVRRAGQRRHPGHEAALELLGIERGKDVAEVIVRWRPVTKRPEPAQQIELLLAEPRDIDEGLRSVLCHELLHPIALRVDPNNLQPEPHKEPYVNT